MIYRALPVIAAVCILGGCGEEPRADRAPFSYGMEAPTGDERRALASMAALEADLAQAGSLQGDERIEAERRLGPVVAKNADLCVGTRLENKGWYLLASWRFQFVNETAATLEALDRLDRCGSPILKQAGRNLRVQVLCRQGRLNLARPLAESLVRDIPQFQPTLDLVALHERVGQAAPALPGLTRPTAPVLLMIAASWDEGTRARLARLLGRAAAAEWTPILVLFDATPAVIPTLPGLLLRPDLQVVHARTASEVAAWREAWTPPSEFFVAALKSDGTLLAVDLRTDDPLPLVAPIGTMAAPGP